MNTTGKGGFGDHPEHINRGGAVNMTSVLRDRASSTTAQEIADKLLGMAKEGYFPAMKYVYDRLDGMPRQALEVSGPGEEPIGLVFVRPNEVAEDSTSTSTG